jgi:hypothetical protein
MIHIDPPMMIKITTRVKRKEMLIQWGLDSIPTCIKKKS